MKTSKDLKQSGSTDAVSGLFVFVLYLYTAVFFTVLRIYGKITPKTNFGGIYLKISVKTQGKWTQTDTLWSALFIDDRLKKDPGTGRPFPCSFFCGRRGKNLLYTPSGLGRQRKRMPCAGNDYDPYGVPEYFGVLEPDLGQVEKMLGKRRDSSCRMSCQRGKDRFPGLGVL